MKPICDGFIQSEKKPCAHSVGDDFQFCDLDCVFRCTEWLRRFEPTLSYSTIRDSYCKRKLWLSYVAGYQLKVKSLPMRLGEIAGWFLNYLHDKDESDLQPIIPLDGLRDDEGNLPIQVEAIRGLFKGYKEREFSTLKGKTQSYFQWREDGYPQIHGYLDLAVYKEKIGYEFKYTKKPDAYSTKFIIQDQIATYFLGSPSLERITLRAIQVPELRLAKNESHDDYRERVYQDFLSRPLHYIRDTSFWRSEFNYDELREKYKMISQEILRYLEMGGMKYFYQSNSPQTCFGEGTGTAVSNCEYLEICSSGVVSELIYKKREIKI
jgi:hypothetical protein